MAALVAVMFIVCYGAFDWHSVRPSTLRAMPKSETAVMLTTVAVVLLTHDLAYGVIAGTVLACVLFARRVAHLVTVTREPAADGRTVTYRVRGQLFFASSNDLVGQFEYPHDPHHILIDVSEAHVWDASSVAALDAITTKYAARGTGVDIVGMNAPTAALHGRLAGRVTGG